jgi:hypothetical protein
MKPEQKKILYKIQRRMTENIERNEDFAAYDDMDNMTYELPFEKQEWMPAQVSSVPHNALKTVTNIFNTYSPKWEILPRGGADIESAEQLERWLEWQMYMTNMKGAQEPFRNWSTYRIGIPKAKTTTRCCRPVPFVSMSANRITSIMN